MSDLLPQANKEFGVSQNLSVCRTGWLGVWDALKSAIMRKPRLEVVVPTKISFYFKGSGTVTITRILFEHSSERSEKL